MDIKLIQGEFNSNDALELIAQMIHVKIKYHENKICSISNEEDIKLWESKIKRLQQELFDLKSIKELKEGIINLEAVIKIKK